MNISIRPFQASDQDRVFAYLMDVFDQEWGGKPYFMKDLEDIDAFYGDEKSGFWMVIDGDQIIGTVALKDYGHGRAYLKRMFVSKSYRGSGIAQQMLETVLRFAKKVAYKSVYLGTGEKNQAAVCFYTKEGFKEISSLPQDMPDYGDTVFFSYSL